MVRYCALCRTVASHHLAWRCSCTGPLEYDWTVRFDPALIDHTIQSQWRYGTMLMPPAIGLDSRVSLGEGLTPLVTIEWEGAPVVCKLEYLMPTGSYKDRGSATLLSVLRAEGVTSIVEDSSGNAGASVAAYASAAGIQTQVFVPAHASPAKKAQISIFGAYLEEVQGSRTATSAACHLAALHTMYASHAWHPAFLLGQMSIVWELWEQTAGRLPNVIVVPLGQGGLLLGFYRGLLALRRAGLITHMPHLVGVQAQGCAPVVQAWNCGVDLVTPVDENPTVAEGIRIGMPARGVELLGALRETDGWAVSVDDQAIRSARTMVARRGLFIEMTSAAALAAIPAVRAKFGQACSIMVPLSGSGLKDFG
jgi:threonine synthase